jgi:hypothetical protein
MKQDILLLKVTSVMLVMNYRCFVGEGKESLSTVFILNTRNLFWTITSVMYRYWMYTVDRLSLPSPRQHL